MAAYIIATAKEDVREREFSTKETVYSKREVIPEEEEIMEQVIPKDHLKTRN